MHNIVTDGQHQSKRSIANCRFGNIRYSVPADSLKKPVQFGWTCFLEGKRQFDGYFNIDHVHLCPGVAKAMVQHKMNKMGYGQLVDRIVIDALFFIVPESTYHHKVMIGE